MKLSINDFDLSSIDINKINNWLLNLDNKVSNIPLVITGNSGSGKTELVNVILEKYSKIYINSLISNNINEYINSILYKKDICNWFGNTKEYKAIIFDNILNTDKIYIREIDKIIKNIKNIYSPVIITSINLNNKKLLNIYSKSIHIHLNYSNIHYNNIVYNLLKDVPKNIINELIRKSNKNLNYIKNNRLYIKNSYIKLNEIDLNNYNNDMCSLTNKLKNKYTISELFTIYSSDYNIISLNMIDNIIYNNKNLNIISKIYNSIVLFDIYEQYKIKHFIYNYDLSVLFSIVIPYHYIHKYNIKLNKIIKYNSYISKSLIYTNNIYKDTYNSCYQYIYYYILLELFINNYDKNIMLKFLIKYKCDKKIFNFMIKLYNLIFSNKLNKNDIKKINLMYNIL